MNKLYNIKIGELDIKKMVAVVFWIGVIIIVKSHIVIYSNIPYFNTNIEYTLVTEGFEVKRVANTVKSLNFNPILLHTSLFFIKIIMLRISTEIMYIVLKGFKGLHKD